MRGRNETHLDRLGDQIVHATDYRCAVIRGAQFREHRGHQVRLLHHVLLKRRLFALLFHLAKLLRTLVDYQLEIIPYVVIQSQP